MTCPECKGKGRVQTDIDDEPFYEPRENANLKTSHAFGKQMTLTMSWFRP